MSVRRKSSLAIFLENQAKFYSLWLRKIYPPALPSSINFVVIEFTLEKLMKKSLLNQIKLLGCSASQNLDNQWLIEIPTDQRKLLLQEQTNNKWLLISNGNPQLFLNTRQILKYIKTIKENPIRRKSKGAFISAKLY